MTTTTEKRHFERVPIQEQAIAVDDTGFQLGRITHAGGGGFGMDAHPHALSRLRLGAHMTITVVEPASGTSNSMRVEIRYLTGTSVGMQFI